MTPCETDKGGDCQSHFVLETNDMSQGSEINNKLGITHSYHEVVEVSFSLIILSIQKYSVSGGLSRLYSAFSTRTMSSHSGINFCLVQDSIVT